MHKQQISLHGADMFHHGAALVPFLIALGSSHIPFCIAGVVAIPTCNWCSRHCTFEDVTALGQTHGTQVATIAPAIDSHSLWVGQSLLHAPSHSRSLIFHFNVSHVKLQGSFKVQTSTVAAAVVTFHHQEAFAPQGLCPQIRCHAPVVGDELNVWTSIARYHCGVRSRSKFCRIRFVNRALQGYLFVCGLNREELRLLQVQSRNQRIFILVDGTDLTSILQAPKLG
mmetsp:Transcript_20763/g.34204  ORF Transcript_20763/g.34204 Transcript_20763/m.34204 type:complete len:226 (-) Transcript_20763:190-867(-)